MLSFEEKNTNVDDLCTASSKFVSQPSTRRAAARQERAVEATVDQSDPEKGFGTALESDDAEEALAQAEENQVVTSKSSAEEVPNENESENVDPVTIDDLMAFLKKSEAERLIEREQSNKHYSPGYANQGIPSYTI